MTITTIISFPFSLLMKIVFKLFSFNWPIQILFRKINNIFFIRNIYVFFLDDRAREKKRNNYKWTRLSCKNKNRSIWNSLDDYWRSNSSPSSVVVIRTAGFIRTVESTCVPGLISIVPSFCTISNFCLRNSSRNWWIFIRTNSAMRVAIARKPIPDPEQRNIRERLEGRDCLPIAKMILTM